MAVTLDHPQNIFFTLWDIDREFQSACEAYEQWQARHSRKRSVWSCLGMKHHDDALGKAMSLGRQVQRLMEVGKEAFGRRFEEGDTTCQTILSAQLLRLQYEIRQTLYDSALSSTRSSIPYDDIMTTAKSIRRTCLAALREQFSRYESREFIPMLPPPRFKVEYCPFAEQLRKDLRASKTSSLRAKKLRPNSHYDDRELCPHCDACISVTAHSGLPAYRGILFTSHIARDRLAIEDKAMFACNSCYKTFDDSYAFLEHVFQRQIDSDRSCLRKTQLSLTLNEQFMESNPSLVEQCLKNCLLRELTRVRTQKMSKDQVVIREKEIVSSTCSEIDLSYIKDKPLPPHPTSHRNDR